jgi:hypothetical protein
VLSAAIRNIDSMFWFGVFEYYDASVCLLAFQLGQFDARLCSCAAPARAPLSRLVPVSMSSNRSKADLLSVAEVSELAELTLLDAALYDHSLRVFMRRVASAERATNTTILCHPTRRREEVEQIRSVYAPR